MFSEVFLEELAERNDIADVVGEYVNLSKRSGQNLFGLCPFHNEKTASFSVSPSKQIYHCFGCGKGGGVINFIMEIEGFTFPEAVEHLAKRAGMKIPVQEYDPDSKKRERILALNRDAARFFFEQLSSEEGKKAKAYMASRQLTAQTVKSFGLGFAPDSWDSLEKAMRAKGYSDFELLDAGLVKRGQKGGFYDAFRNRLMFPVIDVRSDVIGFSGRILGDGEPKYLNSPETAVFNKGRNLFGLNLAKKSKLGYIILVEGNVDVVMLHQAGFDSAVASLGTSLTDEQARLISRYSNEVVLAYDGDGAGRKAADRAIKIFENLDVKTKVLRMDGAKDPDEFIKKMGAERFKNLIEHSESQIDFRLHNILSKYDISIPEQKVDFLREASALVASFPGNVERQVYSARVAESAGVKPEVVTDEVERRRKKLLADAKKADGREQLRVTRSAQPPEKSIKYEDVGSAKAEEGVVRLLYKDPAMECDLAGEEFTSAALAHIYSVMKTNGTSLSALTPLLPQEEMNLLVSIIESGPGSDANANQAMQDYISRIRKKDNTTDLRELANKLKEEKSYK